MKRPDLPKDEIIESLGPYFLMQGKAGHRLTQDTLFLSEFAAASLKPEDIVIDLGTSTGAIPLLLAGSTVVARIIGVEIDAYSAGLAQRNVRENGLTGRIEILNMDWRDLKEAYPEGSFTAVVSNPPYTKAGAGRLSPKMDRAAARSEIHGTLNSLLDVTSHLAGDKGRAFLVFPASRFSELVFEAAQKGFKPVRMKPVRAGAKQEASLFLIELGRSGGCVVEEPVVC